MIDPNKEIILKKKHFSNDQAGGETIGYILNLLRVGSGKTQKDVAEGMKCDQYRISEIERDYENKKPKVSTLLDFLNCIGFELVIRKKKANRNNEQA